MYNLYKQQSDSNENTMLFTFSFQSIITCSCIRYDVFVKSTNQVYNNIQGKDEFLVNADNTKVYN